MTLYNSIQNDYKSLTFKNITCGPVNSSSFGLGCKAHCPQVQYFMQTEINFDTEIWKDVPGFNHMMASSFGRIKIKGHSTFHSTEGCFKFLKDRILKLKIKPNGYQRVSYLAEPRGKAIGVPVHRLVAYAFISVPDKSLNLQINHINGIKHDNRPENLEWCTAKENTNHAFDNGLRNPPQGSRHYWSILTDDQVINIRNSFKEGEKIFMIAQKMNIKYATAFAIAHNKTWKHLL